MDDVLEAAAGTSGNLSLVHFQASVLHLAAQIQIKRRIFDLFIGLFFRMGQYVHHVFIEFTDRNRIAGMEGKGYHGLGTAQIHYDGPVIAGCSAGLHRMIGFRSSMHGKISFCLPCTRRS